MGDVVSSHLDESKRDMISARSGVVMAEFGRLYEQQYAVALFNNVRFDIEGGGGPQYQLLHRKIPLEDKSIFSGSLFQFLEENKKWRNRFLFIPDSYTINCYDNKSSQERNLHPKATINCAGYKVLTSMEQYLELISGSLPGMKAKVGSSPFLKCATQFPLILWHPFARHYCFCVVTEKEQEKWHAVLQDCVRHTNDGLSEENKVQTPAFTDAVRLYRQAQGHYGTWEMMCGVPAQILSNLVMEGLLPELRELISPRLKGKLHERQRNWMLISDAVYGLVETQCQAQYEVLVKKCEEARSSLEASIRTDMDQIITSKEHVTNKIRAVVLPKAEKLLKVSIQPYIGSILDALMEPTSRGFFEVRDLFFRELVDMSKNTLNEGTKETVAQHMEKVSMLAFHPVKMQSCYERVEQLSLEGLQQRFDVSSPSVFVQRAQILMREQMDNAVYTFEQILHQSLECQGSEELTKNIQRCQDRVIKKFDYDSSSVRKRFFREALLQIFIPYMLKQLSPSCGSELPRFQELIFEDFSRFILVENIFEEVVLHSVMKDIMMAVKEAAVQRRHNLYRDSIVLSNSDPSLHLLGEKPSIDWAGEYGGAQEEAGEGGEGGESQKTRRMKQVVSIIQVEGSPVLPTESCIEVPGVNDIPEEAEEEDEEDGDGEENSDGTASPSCPKASDNPPNLTNGCISGQEDKPEGKEEVPLKLEAPTESPSSTAEKKATGTEEEPQSHQEVSEEVLPPPPKVAPEETTESPPPPHNDSGFQSPSSEGGEGEMEETPSTVGPAPPEKLPEVIEKEAPSLPEVLPEVLEEAPPPPEKLPEVLLEAPPSPEALPEVLEEAPPSPEALPEVLQKEAAPPPPEALPEVLLEAPPSPEALPEVLEEAAPSPEALPEVLQKEAAPPPPEALPEVLQKEAAPPPPEALPEVLEEAPPSPEALPEVLEEAAPPPPEALPEVLQKEAAPPPQEALPEVLQKEAAPPPPEALPEVLQEAAPPPPEALPEVLQKEAAPPPPEALPEVLQKEAAAPPDALPEVLEEAPPPPEALPEVLQKEAPAPPEALSEVPEKMAPSPPEKLPEVLEKEAPLSPEELPEVLQKEALAPRNTLPEVLKEAPSPPEALPEVLKEAPPPSGQHPEVLEKEAPPPSGQHPEVLEKEAPPPSGQHPEVLEK